MQFNKTAPDRLINETALEMDNQIHVHVNHTFMMLHYPDVYKDELPSGLKYCRTILPLPIKLTKIVLGSRLN